jgi:hypothetical protein
MQPFLVIIGLLVVGNAFVLILLYPQQEQSGSDWGDGPDFLLIPPGWLQASDVVFVRTTEALFTSLNMMFFGAEPEQLAEASSPTLAAWHYIYYVSLTPLIMMNLLIALMGGSYERVNETMKQTMQRQRAELLISLEVLMSTKEKENMAAEFFPRWLFWYRPKEPEEVDDSLENGVVNGVHRALNHHLAVQNKEMGKNLADMEKEMGKNLADMEKRLLVAMQRMVEDANSGASAIPEKEKKEMEMEIEQVEHTTFEVEE